MKKFLLILSFLMFSNVFAVDAPYNADSYLVDPDTEFCRHMGSWSYSGDPISGFRAKFYESYGTSTTLQLVATKYTTQSIGVFGNSHKNYCDLLPIFKHKIAVASYILIPIYFNGQITWVKLYSDETSSSVDTNYDCY